MLEYLFNKQTMSVKSILEIWNMMCDKKNTFNISCEQDIFIVISEQTVISL